MRYLNKVLKTMKQTVKDTMKESMEMDETFKRRISQLLSLAEVRFFEVVVGIKSTPDGQMIWATNGRRLKEKLLTEGLRFGEADDFFDETESKDEYDLENVEDFFEELIDKNLEDEDLLQDTRLKDMNILEENVLEDEDAFIDTTLKERNILEDNDFLEKVEMKNDVFQETVLKDATIFKDKRENETIDNMQAVTKVEDTQEGQSFVTVSINGEINQQRSKEGTIDNVEDATKIEAAKELEFQSFDTF
jgi:hypothetical protein